VNPEAILLEPTSCGAFAATAAAIARLVDTNTSELALITPSDQSARQRDRPAFRRAMYAATPLADAVILGAFAAPIRSWICNRQHFAEDLIDSGWLLATAETFAELIKAAAPAAWKAAVAAKSDLGFIRLDPAAYASMPTIYFTTLLDQAGEDVRIHAIDFSPVTAQDWMQLHAAKTDEHDVDGNLTDGDAILMSSKGCYVSSTDRLTTLAGVKDLAAVMTDDAILIANMNDPGSAYALTSHLRESNRVEAMVHPMEHRPWGDFRRLTQGPRYQVKRITVKPGGSTSLQKHHHRAEHWVVVAGTAQVTVDDETWLLQENEAAYLPLGSAHRLANPGKIPLELIEVQSGGYLGEDDIERLDDPCKRGAVA
jgi:mannose-1-phosphate guanylyltransferase/mannose-6-phosphate isomerase